MERHGYVSAPVQNNGADEFFVLRRFWHKSLAVKDWRVHPKGSAGC